MKTTLGLIFALMLGGTSAYAQGGPSEKMQAAPSAREQGAGDAGMRGNDGGTAAQSRDDQKSAQPNSKSDRGNGKQAQDNREDKSSKGRSDKDNSAARANKEEPKGPKSNDRAEDRSRSDKDKSSQTTEDHGATQRDQSAEKKSTERPEQGKQAATENKGDAKHVDLSSDKRDRVKTALRETTDVKHRTNVNIDLRIGTRLPRDFDLVVVPESVVAIVPEYRGYLFGYVDDDYVICDPQTYEVVAVIPVSGGPNYASDHSNNRCSDHLSLSADDKDLVIQSISREGHGHTVDVRDLRPGWSVPRDVELLKFPDPVLDRVGELSSCRYFVAEDKIAIVSPDEEKVVAVIDKG